MNRAERVPAPEAALHEVAPDPAATRFAVRALADMQDVARRDFGAFRLQPGSLGSSEHWSRHHLLHWVTLEHEGREVRLYHLTEKEHPAHRHVAAWTSHEPYPTAWERVH
jgi:hypothetical protein